MNQLLILEKPGQNAKTTIYEIEAQELIQSVTQKPGWDSNLQEKAGIKWIYDEDGNGKPERPWKTGEEINTAIQHLQDTHGSGSSSSYFYAFPNTKEGREQIQLKARNINSWTEKIVCEYMENNPLKESKQELTYEKYSLIMRGMIDALKKYETARDNAPPIVSGKEEYEALEKAQKLFLDISDQYLKFHPTFQTEKQEIKNVLEKAISELLQLSQENTEKKPAEIFSKIEVAIEKLSEFFNLDKGYNEILQIFIGDNKINYRPTPHNMDDKTICENYCTVSNAAVVALAEYQTARNDYEFSADNKPLNKKAEIDKDYDLMVQAKEILVSSAANYQKIHQTYQLARYEAENKVRISTKEMLRLSDENPSKIGKEIIEAYKDGISNLLQFYNSGQGHKKMIDGIREPDQTPRQLEATRMLERMPEPNISR